VGLRVGLDWCGKSRPTGIRSPDRPARRLNGINMGLGKTVVIFCTLGLCCGAKRYLAALRIAKSSLYTKAIGRQTRALYMDTGTCAIYLHPFSFLKCLTDWNHIFASRWSFYL